VKSVAVNGGDIYIGVNRQKIKRPRGLATHRPSAAEFEDLTQQLSSQFGAGAAADTGGHERETPPSAAGKSVDGYSLRAAYRRTQSTGSRIGIMNPFWM